MSELEQDLHQSRQKIVSWLTKLDQINKKSYSTNNIDQTNTLLTAISTMDYQKICQTQSIVTDISTSKFISDIADKIKELQKLKEEQPKLVQNIKANET